MRVTQADKATGKKRSGLTAKYSHKKVESEEEFSIATATKEIFQ